MGERRTKEVLDSRDAIRQNNNLGAPDRDLLPGRQDSQDGVMG
jgi:hypothetical protein